MMSEPKIGTCLLCKREEIILTFHHLIPRTLHKKKWYKKVYSNEELNNGIDICEDCHEAIHDFITEKDLGKNYNTTELLLSHPKVQNFITWVSRQKRKRNKTNRSNNR